MFLISLFYTFSKIQETIWKSGKLEWRGKYFLFFSDVPDFRIHFSLKVFGFELGEGEIAFAIQHSSPRNKGGAGMVNGGLGFAHSHLSLTWTLDIPYRLSDQQRSAGAAPGLPARPGAAYIHERVGS